MLNDQLLDPRTFSVKSERFVICIAGTTCAIISRDSDFLDILRERYRYFETSGQAEYEIVVQLLPTNNIPDDLDIECSGNSLHASIKRVNTGNNYIIKQSVKPFLALMNTESKKVFVKTCRSQSGFNSFLRTLFTLILTGKNGLLIRATAIGKNGEASLFCRNRYVRKTTINQIMPEAHILANGLVIIKPHSGHFRVYSTPFQEENNPEKKPARARINDIFFLKRDQTNSVTGMQRTTALLSLFKNSAFFTDDSQLLNNNWENCRRIARAIPAYEVHVCPGTSCGQLLKEQTLIDHEFYSLIQSNHAGGIGIGR